MEEINPVNVWGLSDLCTPWCIYTAVSLHIAEQISAGKNEIQDLAAAAGCDQDALYAMLGHMVSKGIFVEPNPGKFELNGAARQLLDPMIKVSLDLEGIGGRFAHIWGTMLQYVRTGSPAYQELFGLPFFEDLTAHPELETGFDAIIGPPGHGMPDPVFEITGGWEGIRTVVDVGGGTGAMLAEILRIRPHLQGILVDQPATVERAKQLFQETGIAGSVQAIGQSFFEPLPVGADIYLLRGILNDWPDREATQILARCADAARSMQEGYPNGRIVVLKSVGPDEARKDLTIEMLLLGGKHRSLTEFRALANQVGVEVVSAGQQPGGYFVVECRPV